ncbi:hypothetical protein EAO05_05025 [Klebsiella pneumoniae]|nr:hypothetical protein EAO05_05025 [Klebsiella pneumoniae]
MFADHLFTFALSRLTGRFDFTPALPVLFDGLNLQIKLYFRQQTKLYFLSLITYLTVMKGDLF